MTAAAFLKHVQRHCKEINVVVTDICYSDSHYFRLRTAVRYKRILFLAICGSSRTNTVYHSVGSAKSGVYNDARCEWNRFETLQASVA